MLLNLSLACEKKSKNSSIQSNRPTKQTLV